MSKNLLFGEEARLALERGAEKMAKTVRATLGPKGRNVALGGRNASPSIVNSGAKIASNLSLPDPFEDLGAQLLKEAAAKTGADTGGGTTSAILLAYAMIYNGNKFISAGMNPVNIRRGIAKGASTAVQVIKRYAQPANDWSTLKAVAKIASDSDEIGTLVADAITMFEGTPMITVEDSSTADTVLNTCNGMRIDRGYLSPYMVPDQKSEYTMREPYILLTDKTISDINDILPLLEAVNENNSELLIIAEDIVGDALSTLICNAFDGKVRCIGVQAPDFGDRRKNILMDISILTGAIVVTADLALDFRTISLKHLGRAKSVTVSESYTVIMNHGKTEKISSRIAQLERLAEAADTQAAKDSLKNRIAGLSGGFVNIAVGAATVIEQIDKRQKVENALNAAISARKSGIVSGGGVAFLQAVNEVKILAEKTIDPDERAGVMAVVCALSTPCIQILDNAGVSGSNIYAALLQRADPDYGYDVMNNQYCYMLQAGIVDPADMVCKALTNAASVAAMILSTEVVEIDTSSQTMRIGDGLKTYDPGTLHRMFNKKR